MENQRGQPQPAKLPSRVVPEPGNQVRLNRFSEKRRQFGGRIGVRITRLESRENASGYLKGFGRQIGCFALRLDQLRCR